MKKLKPTNKVIYFILILTLVFSILVFSRVESVAVESTVEKTAVKTSALPTDSKIFASQKDEIKTTKETEGNVKEGSSAVKKTPLTSKEISKNKFKQKLLKFFKAMVGVLFSALAIFGGLMLYKILREKKNLSIGNNKKNSSFESPKTFKETINFFLDKTNK